MTLQDFRASPDFIPSIIIFSNTLFIMICFIILIVSYFRFTLVVLRDIEKKYNRTLEYDFVYLITPMARARFSFFILCMYLNEKKIFKNKLFMNKNNPFLKINYRVLEEKKSNIRICFLIFIMPIIASLSVFVIFLTEKLYPLHH